MAYLTAFDHNAAQELSRLPQQVQRQIVRRIERLAESPWAGDVKLVQGEERMYRVRAGVYRILYDIYEDEQRIHILAIGHRRDVYRRR